MNNKVWEIVEKEARSGYEKKPYYRKGMRGSMRDNEHMQGDGMGASYRSYKHSSDEMQEAYDCGFDDGYSDAMKKIFDIIKNAD